MTDFDYESPLFQLELARGLVALERRRMRRAALVWRAASLLPERVIYLDEAVQHRDAANHWAQKLKSLLPPPPAP